MTQTPQFPDGQSQSTLQDDSFIVRVYRCELSVSETKARITDRVQLTGVVEMTVSGQREVFRSLEELWLILSGGHDDEH